MWTLIHAFVTFAHRLIPGTPHSFVCFRTVRRPLHLYMSCISNGVANETGHICSLHSTDDSDVPQRQPGVLQCAAVPIQFIHSKTNINIGTRGEQFINGR